MPRGGSAPIDPKAEARRLFAALPPSTVPFSAVYKRTRETPEVEAVLRSPTAVQIEFCRCAIEALRDHAALNDDADDVRPFTIQHHVRNCRRLSIAHALLPILLRRDLGWDEKSVTELVGNTAAMRSVSTFMLVYLVALVDCVERALGDASPTALLDNALERLSEALGWTSNKPEAGIRARIVAIRRGLRAHPIEPGEAWGDAAIRHLDATPAKTRASWCALLRHCMSATASAPSPAWIRKLAPLHKPLSRGEFKRQILAWFPLVDKPRTHPFAFDAEWDPDPNLLIIEPHAAILKGLVWCCGLHPDPELTRAVAALALSAYRKIRLRGPRLVALGNACVWALGNVPGTDGVGQLAILKLRVKFGTAQKLIEKALTAAATRLGLPRDEIEELAVPTYGLTEVGLRREPLGAHSAEIVVRGSAVELICRTPDGRPLRGIPAALRTQHADEIKELKQAFKDVQRMLPAQCDRIDQLALSRRTWPYHAWRERYLDHPLVGVHARRLIWRFEQGGQSIAGAFAGDGLVDVGDRQLSMAKDDVRVALWHPIDVTAVEEVLAWRAWFERHQIRQPFKQAYREIYLLTDAERATRTYSNRFAAHVLRQHQFHALCGRRGWRNKLRLAVDDEFPPATRYLPQWGLRAEFWIDGVDENDWGSTYRFVSTDQVRFHAYDAAANAAEPHQGRYRARPGLEVAEPLALEEIPRLVFSEVMRDIDLFVGVASVGNDPTWSEGGPQGRFVDYWRSVSFGALSENGRTRQAALERIIPRLAIHEHCAFAPPFLIVKGGLRTYKIHLGSGNILMEPNDQYLCIVPKPTVYEPERIYLPFEGDRTLSVIISKALMLAADTQITDESILAQIRG